MGHGPWGLWRRGACGLAAKRLAGVKSCGQLVALRRRGHQRLARPRSLRASGWQGGSGGLRLSSRSESSTWPRDLAWV